MKSWNFSLKYNSFIDILDKLFHLVNLTLVLSSVEVNYFSLVNNIINIIIHGIVSCTPNQ